MGEVRRLAGLGHEVEVRDDVVVVRPTSGVTTAKRVGKLALTAYSDPVEFLEGFAPAQRSDLLRVLLSDNEAFVALAGALREELGEGPEGSTGDTLESQDGLLDQLMKTFRTNRAAFGRALQRERSTLVRALKGKTGVAAVAVAHYLDRESLQHQLVEDGDEVTVILTSGGETYEVRFPAPSASAIREVLGGGSSSEASTGLAAGADPSDLAGALSKLAALRTEGLLDDDEYRAAKARLLSSQA